MDADVAVHADVALEGLAVALHDQGRHPRVGPEVARVAHLHFGVVFGEIPALFPDALFEDAGEEEVGEDGDAPGAEPPATLQRLGHARGSEAHEGRLDERVRPALEEEPGHLREVAVRVRVGGAPAHYEDGCPFSLLFGNDGGDALVHQLQELGADAEGAAVVEVQVGVGQLLAHKGRGDVVLGVAGGEEHERDGGDLTRALSLKLFTHSEIGGRESSMNPPSTGIGAWSRTRETSSWNSSAPRGSRLPCPTMSSAGSLLVVLFPLASGRRSLNSFLLEVQEGVQRRGRDRGPPLGPWFATAGSPLRIKRSFDSAAPTNPTGSPTTSAGLTSISSSSKSAVGAFPTTQTASKPASLSASLNPAAERVMSRCSASSRARGSETKQRALRAVMPAATIPASVTTLAPLRRASRPRLRAASSRTRLSAYSRSAEAWITRSATARESGPRCEEVHLLAQDAVALGLDGVNASHSLSDIMTSTHAATGQTSAHSAQPVQRSSKTVRGEG